MPIALIHAAVFAARPTHHAKLVQALKRAGLRVSAAETPDQLKREQLLVFGPGIPHPARLAHTVRQKMPATLIMVAQTGTSRPAYADAVLPLPLSPRDLRARLPELALLRNSPTAGSEPVLDPLTAFYTFNHFKELLYIEVKRARRHGFSLSAALVAVDPLRRELTPTLRAQLWGGIALAIRRSLRDTDYPVQYSGDHALLLMPHTDLAGALVVTRRICDRVGHATLNDGDEVMRPTVSVGVSTAEASGPALSFGDLIKQARASLDRATARGGNRVEFAEESPA